MDQFINKTADDPVLDDKKLILEIEQLLKCKVMSKTFVNEKGELVLLGSDFCEEPREYEGLSKLVGKDEKPVIEGEVFRIVSKTINRGSELVYIIIVSKNRTFAVKAFMSRKRLSELKESVRKGDVIRAKGSIEFDEYEHEYIMMAEAIKKVGSKLREDTYPCGRRVELHCHTKMSDNDGFNEIADVVKSAAFWGQPAVAITDHGVVHAFPEAAKEAAKLARDGKSVKIIYGMEGYLYPDEDAIREDGSIDIRKNRTYHVTLLAKNQTGLKNLYKLVSLSHIDYFYKRPRIPRSILQSHREGILVGSACELGELYQAVECDVSDEELDRIASFYDYLEIQPLDNNGFLIDCGTVKDENDLIANNMRIIDAGDRLGKLTVATTDAHYPTPDASIFRNIILGGIGFKDTLSDDLYLRTTDEMMEEFAYLGNRAEEIVITNTNKIADMVEDLKPVPDGMYIPKIDGAEEELRNSCYMNAKSIYGDPLPAEIEERLEAELSYITENGNAYHYAAAMRLVRQSNEDGYIVGSRGSVGSSFAATMAGITEVNPLPPHYICPECKHFEWSDESGKYDVGYDMPDKCCPKCGALMKKDGFNIPFESFLGLDGKKEPDIDLNFAGEYQPIAARNLQKIFGKKNVYNAGYVATIADKSALGYVKHYVEEYRMNATKYDIEYLTEGCAGVKRTTGQHPGGFLVVPDGHEIYEFTPVQKPANRQNTNAIISHFDYHYLDTNLQKFDILGHDVPQILKHLHDMTGIDPMTISLDDKETLSIFTSLDALNIQNEDYRFTHGTYAIPEFSTEYMRRMLDDVHPATVSALIKMSGFAHGTDVWENNAKELLKSGTATIDEVISCREEVMTYLLDKGVLKKDAFIIMELMRKNRSLSDEQIDLMKEHGVPDWYIESCITSRYMFPKGHVAAYIIMSLRMAWYKVNYPEEFYAAWFTMHKDHFDTFAARKGLRAIEKAMDDMQRFGKITEYTQRERLNVFEVMYEAISRGCIIAGPELGVSDPCDFSVVDGKIMVPFSVVNGINDEAAKSLCESYAESPFVSIEDVKARTILTDENILDLRLLGTFNGIPESSAISLFEL